MSLAELDPPSGASPAPQHRSAPPGALPGCRGPAERGAPLRPGTAALPAREKGDGLKAGREGSGPQRRDPRSAAGGEGSPRRAAANGASPAAPTCGDTKPLPGHGQRGPWELRPGAASGVGREGSPVAITASKSFSSALRSPFLGGAIATPTPGKAGSARDGARSAPARGTAPVPLLTEPSARSPALPEPTAGRTIPAQGWGALRASLSSSASFPRGAAGEEEPVRFYPFFLS